MFRKFTEKSKNYLFIIPTYKLEPNCNQKALSLKKNCLLLLAEKIYTNIKNLMNIIVKPIVDYSF